VRVRVLLLNRDYPGGQTTHVDALAAALASRGLEVALAVWLRPGAPLWRDAHWAAIEGGVPIETFDSLRRLDALASRLRPDVVHAHSQATWAAARELAARRRIPLILTVHRIGLDVHRFRDSLAAANALIVPDERKANAIASFPRWRMSVIPNCVDSRQFVPLEKSAPPTIAYVGRVDHTRSLGFEAFIEATRDIPSRVKVVGRVPRALQKPGDHVEYLGWRADPRSLLGRIDVVTAVGRSLLEGMSAGCVGIALGERYHGIVAPGAARRASDAGDFYYGALPSVACGPHMVRALRAALMRLLASSIRLRTLQQASRDFIVEKLDVAAMARQTAEVYAATLRGSHARRLSVTTPAIVRGTRRSTSAVIGEIEAHRELVDCNLSTPARWRGPLRREFRGPCSPADVDRYRSAFDFLVSMASRRVPIDAELVLEIHERAVGGARYRSSAIRVGSQRSFPNWRQVPELMNEVLGLREAADFTLADVARLHVELVMIHPFPDGNGRVARLLSSYILMRLGFRSTLFTAVEQHYRRQPARYASMLRQRHNEGIDRSHLVRYLLEQMAENSRHTAWFRARSLRLRRACIDTGMPPGQWEQSLIEYDFTLRPTPLSHRVGENEHRWPALRATLSEADSARLGWQLNRLRAEEEEEEQ